VDRVHGRPYRDDEIVSLIVAYGETALRGRLKAMGGRWNPADKLWLTLWRDPR
jgi:hypothetical protein